MAASRPMPLVAPVMTMVGSVRTCQIRARVGLSGDGWRSAVKASAWASEDGVDMQACSSATGRPTLRYSGYFRTITHDGEMSTTSRSTPAHRSPRRDLELALGVEINALLSASRALDVRTAAAFHPDLQPAAFHLARWLYAYGPAN